MLTTATIELPKSLYDTTKRMQDWIPHRGPQTEALSRSEKELLYGGARGGGKTEAGLAWLAEPEYVGNPLYKGLVLRKNYDDLSDWLARAEKFYSGIAVIQGKPPIIKFANGSFVRTGHFKDSKTFDKYQGHEYHKILIEELTKVIKSLKDYQKLLSLCRSTVPGLVPQMFLTTNPGGIGHVWTKKYFVDTSCNKTFIDPISKYSRIFIPAKVEDNPTLMKNDPDYVHFLDSLPDKLKEAWRHGSWTAYEGQFFDEWSDSYVCERDISKALTFLISLDYGYRPDPSSVGFWAVYPDNSVHRFDEIYKHELSYPALAQEIKERMDLWGKKFDFIVADPSAWGDKSYKKFALTGESGWETIQNIVNIPVIKADNSRVAGWGRMRVYFQHKLITIDPVCKGFIEEIPALVHDENKPDDVDTDCVDHACDDVRYLVMSRPMPKKIILEQQIQSGLNAKPREYVEPTAGSVIKEQIKQWNQSPIRKRHVGTGRW